jgi:hypothetical protein
LMVVIARMFRAQLLDGAPDGGFAAVDRICEDAEHSSQLGWKAVEIHQ